MRTRVASVVVLVVGMLVPAGLISAGAMRHGPEGGCATSVMNRSRSESIPGAPTSPGPQEEPARPRLDDSVARSMVTARGRINGNPVLIIQDVLPWGYDSIQQSLAGAGVGYDTILSDELPTVNLSQYDLVIIPSVQPDAYYIVLNANLAKLEDYVIGGGKLWMSACTLSSNLVLPQIPGGVTPVFGAEYYNDILDTSHPWVQGVSNPMYGSYASHNYLTNMTPGMTVVATGQASGYPTLIEYSLGAGQVAVTGQTLEISLALGWDGGPILEHSLLYMFYFNYPWILHLTTADTEQSIERALNELGYSHDTDLAEDWTGIDFSPYTWVLISMDGGQISEASVLKIRTDLIDVGKRVIMLGGTFLQDFVAGVNQYLVLNDTANYYWTISSQPHWNLTDPDHGLAEGLPDSYNFANSWAAYYQLRVTDPDVEVVGVNGDGYDDLFYKNAGFPTGGAPNQSGGLIWFINSPYGDYWADQTDFGVLKQIIANGIQYGAPRYEVSGMVELADGTPLAGVTVSAGPGGETITDASGIYTITGLINSTYTLTPTLDTYTFMPSTRRVIVPPDATGQDFVAVPVPLEEVEITGPANGSIGMTYAFTATAGPPTSMLPVTYTWQATGQAPITHPDQYTLTDSVTYTWETWGAHVITVTATNAGATVSDTHEIWLPEPVDAGFWGAPTTGAAPLTVVFTNTSTGDYDASLWFFGDGTTSTLGSPTYKYGLAGIYTVTLTVSGPGGSDTEIKDRYITVNCGIYLPLLMRTS